MLEIECREGLAVSVAGRPDSRLEVLVQCCLEENEARDDCLLSAGTILGLGSGEILSGSARRTAVWYVSPTSYKDDTWAIWKRTSRGVRERISLKMRIKGLYIE